MDRWASGDSLITGANHSARPAFAEGVAAVANRLATNVERGLANAQAAERLAVHGPNALAGSRALPWWQLVLRQFCELVVVLLLIAAAIAAMLDEWVDAIAILGIVALNAALGIFQHFKAERALGALRKMTSPLAKVIRDGRMERLSTDQIVTGDRVELEAGDHVPADARLITAYCFSTSEAPLTGESTPVEKDAAVIFDATTPLGDRRNMVFMGTSVSTGKASAIVTATGMQTQLGRIAGLLKSQEAPPTPLQQRIHRMGQTLVVICLALVATISALQLARGQSWGETLHLAVSLAVAAVPEGLPAVLTITLALGAQRLARRRALVRRLSSVETLGSVTVICSDKTGTLTRNEMTVREIATADQTYDISGNGYDPKGEISLASDLACHSRQLGRIVADRRDAATTDVAANRTSDVDLELLLNIGVWCNHAHLDLDPDGSGKWRVLGDPTEGAILVAARKAGIERHAEQLELDHELPFDSNRKLMSVVLREPSGDRIVFTKGAPEALLSRCAGIQRAGAAEVLTETDREQVRLTASDMASRALRVLAFAYRKGVDGVQDPDLEQDLILVGLAGMIDPPRAEVRPAIDACLAAGIRPVMITGDHPNTARAIASELGLLAGGGDVLSGGELDQFSPEEFNRRIGSAAVFARVTAEHKLQIVAALQRRSDVVAMTGDGVNDAPAVKSADIGIAMGITGTDVTRESAAMVLTDDNFASIVHAVEEGRAIYDNIQKFVLYLLAGNAGKLIFMFVAALAGWPSPLLAIQLLWLNLVTDGLPALALGMEPTHDRLMRRPPRRSLEPLIDWRRARRILMHGGLTASAALVGFWAVFGGDAEQLSPAQVVAFCILGLSQLAYSFVCRSDEITLYSLGWRSNRPLLIAVAASLGLQAAVVLVPSLHAAFGIEAYPTFGECALIVGLALAPAFVVELLKLRRRTGHE